MALPLPNQCAIALLNALRNAPWRIEHGAPEHIADPDFVFDDDRVQEQGADMAAARHARAIAFGHGQTLTLRVADAVQADRARIQLGGGEELSLDDAEHALFLKEEKRVFSPLRTSLSQALGAFDVTRGPAFSSAMGQVRGRESGSLAAPPAVESSDNGTDAGTTPDTPEVAPPLQPTAISTAKAALDQFLVETEEAFAGALAILGAVGGVELTSTETIARGLDLGFVDGAFSLERHLAVSAALKEHASPFLSRGITRVRAPRSFGGHVVSAAPGAIRLLTAPCLRARRYSDVTIGAGAALGASLLGEDAEAASVADGVGRMFGGACALGTFSPTVGRAIFADAKPAAARNARALRATAVGRAVAQATAASVYCELLENWETHDDKAPLPHHDAESLAALQAQFAEREEELTETVRSAVAQRFGDDLGLSTARGLLAPPMPGGASLSGRLLRAGTGALGVGAAVSLGLSLRERYDEVFPLVPAAYERIADARAPLLASRIGLAQLFDVHRTPGKALAEWLLELA